MSYIHTLNSSVTLRVKRFLASLVAPIYMQEISKKSLLYLGS